MGCGVVTVGVGVGMSVGVDGVGSTRFNDSAMERKAFNSASPYCSCSDGDGVVKSEMMSVAACFGKSEEES